MTERTLESLLLDFRDRGDVAALAAIFDRTSNELLTVALHLVPEPSQAEDVVQATFLAAIQSVESFDSERRGRRVMPWLVGILANHAARVRRERTQSVDPARVDARAEPDPSDEIERRETAQILARAIDELPETCRDVVKRHLLGDERAIEIARSEGVAAGTVRMQILRGLERLRRALPAGLYAVAVPIRGSDAVRARVLDAARTRAAAITAASSTAPVAVLVASIGGTLVSLKILLGVAAIVAALLVTWKLAAPRASETAPSALASAARHEPSSPTAGNTGVLATEPAGTTRAPESVPIASPAAAARGWWLVGHLTGLDGQPAQNTELVVRRIPGESVRGSADANGRFVVDVGALFSDDDPPKELLVSADHPANRSGNAVVRVSSEQCELGKSQRVELVTDVALEAFAVVKGSVQASGSIAIGSVSVCLVPVDEHGAWQSYPSSGLSPSPSTIRAEAGSGAFQFRSNESGSRLVVARCDGFLPCSRAVVARLGETTDVGALRLETGDVSIEGRVSLPFEHAGTKLKVRARSAATAGDYAPGMFEPTAELQGHAQNAEVDEGGQFYITGLAQGPWKLDLMARDNSLVVVQPEATPCLAPSKGVVLGENLGRLRILVQTAGVPVANVHVLLGYGDENQRAKMTTDERGCATFLVDAGIDLAVEACPLNAPRVLLSLPAKARSTDSVHTVEIQAAVVGKATLVLEPAGAGKPPGRVHVALSKPRSSQAFGSNVRLLDGKYTLNDLEPGSWMAEITPSSSIWFGIAGGEFLAQETIDVDLVAGETLRRPIAFRSAGRVRFEIEGWSGPKESDERAHAHILDAQGSTLHANFVVRTYEHDQIHMSSRNDAVPLDAASELAEGLPPGDYQLVLDDPVWTSLPVSFRVDTGATTSVRVPVHRR